MYPNVVETYSSVDEIYCAQIFLEYIIHMHVYRLRCSNVVQPCFIQILSRSITIHQTFRSIMGTSLKARHPEAKIFESRMLVVHVENSTDSQLPRAQQPAISGCRCDARGFFYEGEGFWTSKGRFECHDGRKKLLLNEKNTDQDTSIEHWSLNVARKRVSDVTTKGKRNCFTVAIEACLRFVVKKLEKIVRKLLDDNGNMSDAKY